MSTDKVKYKYITFTFIPGSEKTRRWICTNNKTRDELGEVRWFPRWRQFCYFPTHAAVYSASCLVDIQDFIKRVTEEQKLRRQEK